MANPYADLPYPKCSVDPSHGDGLVPHHPTAEVRHQYLCERCLKRHGRGRGGSRLAWPPAGFVTSTTK